MYCGPRPQHPPISCTLYFEIHSCTWLITLALSSSLNTHESGLERSFDFTLHSPWSGYAPRGPVHLHSSRTNLSTSAMTLKLVCITLTPTKLGPKMVWNCLNH